MYFSPSLLLSPSFSLSLSLFLSFFLSSLSFFLSFFLSHSPHPAQDFFDSNSDCNPSAYGGGAAISVASYGRCARLFKLIEILHQRVNVVNRLSCMPYPATSWSLETNQWCRENVLGHVRRESRSRKRAEISNTTSLATAFHPQGPWDVCYNECQRLAILNEPDIYRKYISTRPAWIFFRKTTTACYKYISGRYIYFPTNCNRANIFNTTVELAKQ